MTSVNDWDSVWNEIEAYKKKRQLPISDRLFQYLNSRVTDIKGPLKYEVCLTNQCNQHCLHCSNGSIGKPYIFRSEDMQAILDQEPLIIVLTGGEPLLYPELELLISMIKKQGAFLKLCTNGVALTEYICEEIICQLGMHDIIQISLDAADERTYESIRGANHFDTLISNICMVRHCLPKVTIELHCVPNRFNIHQIPQIYSLAKELGADVFSTSPLAYLGRAKKEYQADILSLFLLERELYRSSDARTPYMGCLFEVCSLYGMLHNLPSSVFETEIYRCDAGLSTIYINCDAKVYPCVYLKYPAFQLGNLQDGLPTIIARAHKYYIDGMSIKNSLCNTCNLWPICRGGCMGTAYAFRGKAEPGLDPRCSRLSVNSVSDL